MIYITEDQAKKVQYLLDQAIQGNHILFDPVILRKALMNRPTLPLPGTAAAAAQFATEEQQYAVEHHIEKLMGMDHIAIKRAYLERLDSGTYMAVVRTYFNIIENRLFDACGVAH